MRIIADTFAVKTDLQMSKYAISIFCATGYSFLLDQKNFSHNNAR
jgi:hypothetical protein